MQPYTYGEWQGILEVRECLDGIFKLIRLVPSISMIQPLEAAQFLVIGKAPYRWTRARHFPEADSTQQLSIPTACGPWHDSAGHFLTLYISKDYWTFLDPLRDLPHPPLDMQSNIHIALSESFRARNLQDPTLPQYMQVPRISVEQDAPRPAWSCGTIAMCTILNLLFGDRHPHELSGQYITRAHMFILHRALLD